MNFSVNDKIVFKNENLNGEVVKVNSLYNVTVLTSDGFEMNVSVNDIVKIEFGSDKSTSYGNDFYSKDLIFETKKSNKQQKSQTFLKIDLHIELLTSNYIYLSNFEIVQLQLNECIQKLEKALNNRTTKIEIIHGIGEGVLKNEVHKILRDYNLRYFLKKDGGSTEVYL